MTSEFTTVKVYTKTRDNLAKAGKTTNPWLYHRKNVKEWKK